MGRGKKPLLEKVEIQKIAAEGKSIAYIDEKVLFVPNTLPGDIAEDANGKISLTKNNWNSNSRKSTTICNASEK